jgi:sodium/bile acid cotransporter 7
LATHWFLFVLTGVILASWLAPGIGAVDGPLKPAVSVHVMIAVAFFCSGVSLRIAAVIAVMGQIRLHLFIQAFCFLAVPLLVFVLRPALSSCGFPESVITGFTVLSFLPTTIVSAALYARMAGGNETAALCNCVLGNLIGVFLLPLVLLVISGRSADTPAGPIILTLAREVVAPLIIGLLAAHIFPRLRTVWVKHVPNMCLLFIIYAALCDSWSIDLFGKFPLSPLLLLAVVAFLHAATLALCWLMSGWSVWKFSRADRVAALYCGSQKTLALGIPMLAIVFQGESTLGLINLPLLAYHPIQLVVAALLVGPLKRWIGAIR